MGSLAWQAVHHISRETADVEAALAFYRDVMGFEAIWRPDFRFRGAWLLREGVQIHLIEGTPPDRPTEISSTADHIAFHVPDVDAAAHALDEHGIPYRRNVQGGTGTVQLFFHDPDGNTIELATYPPPRPLDAR